MLAKLGAKAHGRRTVMVVAVLAALLLAAGVGLAAPRLSPAKLAFPVLVVWAAGTVQRRTDWWVLLVLAFSCTIFKFTSEEAYIVTVGSYGLTLNEVVVFTLVGWWLLARVVSRQRFAESALDIWVLGFLGLMVVLMSKDVLMGRDMYYVFGVNRALALYLLYFALVWGIRTEAQLRTLTSMVIVFASLTAVAMILQSLLGIDTRVILGSARVESVVEGDLDSPLRILPTGIVLLPPAVCTLVHRFFSRRGPVRWLLVLLLILLASAVLLSYTRALFVGILASILTVPLLGKHRVSMLFRALLLVAVVGGAILILAPVESGLFADRLASGFGLQGQPVGVNTTWRVEEATVYLQKILTSWRYVVFGVGFGVPVFISQYDPTGPYVIENGYVNILFHSGIVGLGLFIGLYMQFLRYSRKVIQQLDLGSPWLSHLVGFTASSVGFLLMNLSTQTLTQKHNSVIVFALILALPRLVAGVKEGVVCKPTLDQNG